MGVMGGWCQGSLRAPTRKKSERQLGNPITASRSTPPSDSRHKELAPLKYLALEEKLYKDPRLLEHLKVFS